MGLLPWKKFDEHFNEPLEQALDKWDPGGQNGYGKARWNKIRNARVPAGLTHAGELALDWVAIQLVLDEASPVISPKLVEPRQGFSSLVENLWEAYSLGRNMGFSDLGTYNPRSTLPGSGKASDHATSRKSGVIGQPACAFDLGFFPATGWYHVEARLFFMLMVGRPEVAYVIVGDRIWSAERASEGVRLYTSGGHSNHIHVSGFRSFT